MAGMKSAIESFLASLIFYTFALPVFAEERVLTIGADQWCPFFCQAGVGYDGYSIELLQEALLITGHKSKYVTGPFDDITNQVENGKYDIHGATDKNFTPTLLIGKEPVAFSRWMFVVKKGSDWKYEGVDSLKGKRFGSIAGYVYSDTLTNYYAKPENKELIFTLSSEKPQQEILHMLMSSKFDFIVEDANVINYWAKKEGVRDQIEFVGLDAKASFYPAYRNNDKKSAELAKEIDSAIREVKKNPDFMRRLRSKYDMAL